MPIKFILLIIGTITVWLLAGFIGFIIEAKEKKYIKFTDEVKEEFFACMGCGIVTLAYFMGSKLKKRFIIFMDRFLWKINNEK